MLWGMKQSGPTMFTQEQGKLRKQLQNLKSKQDKSQKHFLIPSGKVNFEIELTSDAFFHPFFRNKKCQGLMSPNESETKKEAFSTFLCLSSFQQKWKRKKKFWKLSKENWTKNLSWCVWKIYALIIKLFFSPTMKPLPGLETKGVVFSSHSPPKSLFNEGCHNLRTSSLSLFMLPLWPKLPWLWKKNFSGASFCPKFAA